MASVISNLLAGFVEIFSAAFKDPSIFWILTPIIFFWLITEIYFGRFKTEALGWNSSLGYGLNMFWIVIISLKTMFTNSFELFSVEKLIFVIFIALYSIFIIVMSFTHKIKEKIFFFFTAPTLIYFLLGIAVLWINNLLSINLWVAIDLAIIYIMILIIETVIKKFIPAAADTGGTPAGKDPGFSMPKF
jgi:hypothetical protein